VKITALFLILGLLTAACGAPAPKSPPAAPLPQGVAVRDVSADPSGPIPEPPSPTMTELLKQIEAAYRRGDYQQGLALVKKAYELKQNDVSSMDRIGSIYYVLGRYGEALSVWSRALPLEKDPNKRVELQNSIKVTRRSLGLDDVAVLSPPEPPAVVAPPAASTAPAASAPPASDAAVQRKIAGLYKQGLKFYAAGEYLQATTAFLAILDLDPNNADALKALKRLKLDR
jgi:tetratricopeptide (TPR) repeat protein